MPFNRPIPDDKPPSKDSGALRGYVEAEKLLHLAFVLPGSLVLGGGLGWWIDRSLHQHWATITGIVFGSVAGLYYVIQTVVSAENKSRKEEPIQNGNQEDRRDDRP